MRLRRDAPAQVLRMHIRVVRHDPHVILIVHADNLRLAFDEERSLLSSKDTLEGATDLRVATLVCDGHDGDLVQVLDFAGETPNPVEEARRDFVD